MWIGLLIFNLIIIYIHIPIPCARSMANRCQSWLKMMENSVKPPVRFASFPVKTLPDRIRPAWMALSLQRDQMPQIPNEQGCWSRCTLSTNNKPKKESLWMPVSHCKHSEGKSHRKPLVGWLLMLTPLFLAKGDPHERLMVQVLISSSRLQRELRIAMGTPAATASRFSPPNSAPSKSKDCQQRRCKDR